MRAPFAAVVAGVALGALTGCNPELEFSGKL